MAKKAKATRPGTCESCKQPYQRGERIVWKTAVHESCHRGSFAAIPPAPTLEYTRLNALAALEESVQVAAQVNGVTDEMEKMWSRYEKLKSVGLRPGSTQEGRQAFRMALVEIVKLAFPS